MCLLLAVYLRVVHNVNGHELINEIIRRHVTEIAVNITCISTTTIIM